MGSKVQELLDELHTMITEAWGLPLGAEKCMIERGAALEILERIKAQFPQEIAEAKQLVEARAEFINIAKREAETLRKAAEERSRQLIDEQEILRTARERSREMMASAEASSAELKRVASQYVDDTMRDSEEVLIRALEDIRQTRARFKSASRAVASAQPQMKQYSEQPLPITD